MDRGQGSNTNHLKNFEKYMYIIGINFRGFRGLSKIPRKFVPAKKVFWAESRKLVTAKKIRQTLISGNFDMQSLVVWFLYYLVKNAFNLHESTGLLV